MGTGSDWFADSASENEDSQSSKSSSQETVASAAAVQAESSSTDEFVQVVTPDVTMEATVSLIKSRVDRIRRDFSNFDERMDRMRIMQQIIMRAVVDQGITSQTNRSYSMIYLIGGQLGENRRDICRLDGLALSGLLTLTRDQLSETRAYPMGLGCESRDYKKCTLTCESQDLSIKAPLVCDQHGDYMIDFSESVWPDDSLEDIEFCFSRKLELADDK